MTDEAYPDQPNGGRGLARFLQDWTELWREELQAQANDPERVPLAMLAGVAGGGISSDMAAALEMWRTAMVAFAEAVGAETTGAEIQGAKILGAEGPWREARSPLRDARKPKSRNSQRAVARFCSRTQVGAGDW